MILISGPCVIESRDQVLRIAQALIKHQDANEFYFKASFDKANRTSVTSYRGPGMDEGLKILQEVKQEFGCKILTDFHEPSQAQPVSEVADVLQVPAFLCRQTDMIVAAAKTDAVVNIKKGQFLNPKDMQHSVIKALTIRGVDSFGYDVAKKAGVWLTERGTTFGYGNLVVDMRSLVIMREFAPVIFDATHSVQMPGAGDGKSGGDASFVAPLSKAAAAVGVDGFFFETHYDPKNALSDGPNMLEPKKLDTLLQTVKKIQNIGE